MQIPHFVCDSPVPRAVPSSLRIHSRSCHGSPGLELPQPRPCLDPAGESKALAASGICENLGKGALSWALLLLRSPSQPCCRAGGPSRAASCPGPSRWTLQPSCPGIPSCALGWGCTGPGPASHGAALCPAGAESQVLLPCLQHWTGWTRIIQHWASQTPRWWWEQGGAGGNTTGVNNCIKNY